MQGAWGNLDGFKAKFYSAAKSTANAAAQVSRAVATEVVHGVVGAQCLLDYTLEGQVASSGGWGIYLARAKKPGAPHPLVSAWVLEKRALAATDQGKWGIRRLELLLEQCRREVQHLARLKHPSVLHLVHPLEETRTMLVFITEPLFSSLEDILRGGSLPQSLASERRQVRLSELEVKHGLLQLSEALHFLHGDAGLVHKAVCPQHLVITHSGAWKLGGFGFASPLDYKHGGDVQGFDYSDSSPSPLSALIQPPLAYSAPEVATGKRTVGSADVFSLAAVAFELVTHRQLLPVRHSLSDYESRLHSLLLVDMSGVPHALEGVLRQMLAPVADARPPVASFAGCSYFASDVQLRALKFLDSMLQRDPLQRAAFLRDLPALCNQFDSRVLKNKVLPPLLQELRSPEQHSLVVPLVLSIMGHQTPQEFADTTLPALRPLLALASGDTLLLLCQSTELLSVAAPRSVAAELVPQLLVRGMESGDARCQEAGLKQMAALVDTLDYDSLKRCLLPATHELCLSTTSASVRVAAFRALAAAATRTDQPEAEAMLAVAAQVVAVDKTAPTAMCVLGLGEALARQWGAKLAAERVLPALTPLLVMPSLSAAQFGTALKTVKEVLAEVEGSRAGTAAADGANGGGGRGRHASAGGGAAANHGGAGRADDSVDWLAATTTAPGPSRGTGPSRPLGSVHSTRPPAPAAAAPSLGALSALPFRGPGSAAQKAPSAAGSARRAAGSGNGSSGRWDGPDTAFVSAPPPSRPAAAPPAAADPFAWPAAAAGNGAAQSSKAAPAALAGGGGAARPMRRAAAAPPPSDPFAGLNLSAPQAAVPAAVPVLPAGGDPFDTLALQHAGKGNSDPGGGAGGSLI